jgi:predicted nucleic acid-binding protein
LWRWRAGSQVRLYELTEAEIDRMAVLMEKYQDRPMDLADASLVVIAERWSLRQVFTVDGDFHIYRLADGSALESLP